MFSHDMMMNMEKWGKNEKKKNKPEFCYGRGGGGRGKGKVSRE
jgi:hypothetical protein